MTHDEMIAVIQAHKEGVPIQYRSVSVDDSREWFDCHNRKLVAGELPIFNFADFEYRVKPEPPKPREWWITKNGEAVLGMYESEKQAKSWHGRDYIHVREVLEEEIREAHAEGARQGYGG